MLVAPRCHEEGTNDFSSSGVSPVEAFSLVVLPVKAYFTVKEIIGKKSEKKKTQKNVWALVQIGLVPRAHVLYPCHKHFLRRAEYISKRDNLLSLAFLQGSNYSSRVVTHRQKTRQLICRVHTGYAFLLPRKAQHDYQNRRNTL